MYRYIYIYHYVSTVMCVSVLCGLLKVYCLGVKEFFVVFDDSHTACPGVHRGFRTLPRKSCRLVGGFGCIYCVSVYNVYQAIVIK